MLESVPKGKRSCSISRPNLVAPLTDTVLSGSEARSNARVKKNGHETAGEHGVPRVIFDNNGECDIHKPKTVVITPSPASPSSYRALPTTDCCTGQPKPRNDPSKLSVYSPLIRPGPRSGPVFQCNTLTAFAWQTCGGRHTCNGPSADRVSFSVQESESRHCTVSMPCRVSCETTRFQNPLEHRASIAL